MAAGDSRDISRLVTHFEGILETLNTNIYRYREAKVAEFSALYQEQLASTPSSVANEVRKAIGEGISKFPELHGFTVDTVALEMDAPVAATSPRPAPSPQPDPAARALQEPAEIMANQAESRREHDMDLAGVITPGFLPLLDASKPASGSTPPVGPAGSRRQSSASLEPVTPPTDVTSPRSGNSARRSALRRTSSASKSPRKVRFDFGGDDSDSGGKEMESNPFDSPANDAQLDSPSTSKFPASILDDPTEAPPPKKVSSVERLRMLGRRPYKSQEESDADAPPINLDNSRAGLTCLYPGGKHDIIDLNESQVALAASSDNDEGFFPEINTKNLNKMRPSSKQTSPTSPTAPRLPSVPEKEEPRPDSTVTPDAVNCASRGVERPSGEDHQAPGVMEPETRRPEEKQWANPKHDENDDDDDLFTFDDENGISKPRAALLPVQGEQEEQGDGSEILPDKGTPVSDTQMTVSPPAPMARHSQNIQQPSGPRSLFVETVGSYKGHTVTMPVVKDLDVYAQAMSMGDFNTFVGSINGASGIDAGDLSSFRASVGNNLHTGSPKSFSQRFMMEEPGRSVSQHQHQHQH